MVKAATAPRLGEVWLAQLDPTIGSDIQKPRPCLVVSPDEMNLHLRTVLVAPMTTGSHPASFRIPVVFRRKRGLILLDQMRTLDKRRLAQRLGVIPAHSLKETQQTLQQMFTPD